MSDFEELYRVFIKTQPAKSAVQEVKRLHPDLSARQAAAAAQNLAELAYNLDMDAYFNPEIREGSVSRNWNNQFRAINRLQPEQLEALVAYSEIYADKVMPCAANETEDAMLRAVFAMSARAMVLYAPDRLRDKKLHFLMASAAQKIADNGNRLTRGEKYSLAMSVFTNLYQDNPAAFFNRLGMIGKAVDGLTDRKNLGKVCEEIDNIYQNEGDITPVMARGFEKYVIPVVNEIPDFATLSAEHDCSYGEYGLIGYTNKVLTSQWTPRSLNEAIGILKEVPTPDMVKRETIRTKAIQLEEAEFSGLRDFLHSETIGVSELVGHMLEYYHASKGGNNNAAQTAADKIKSDLRSCQSEDFASGYLDISRYERVIDRDSGLTAVEALQIVADNVRKNNAKPPLVNDPELDGLSQRFLLEGYTDTAAFGRFMEVLNNKIIQNIETQKIGISPKMVDLMFWCDKKCTNLLKDRDFEHQCGDHKSPWFKQVALFAELTNSAETGFNRKGFDAYFKHVQAQDYFFDANNILIKRQRNNIFKLFQASKQACRQVGENLRRRLERSGRGSDEIDFEIEKLNGIYDQRNRRMISGNLVGEIFKLNDFKKPSTRLGERYAKEMKRKVQLERPVEKTLLKIFKTKSRRD